MAMIHFIWWGPYISGGVCVDTPNSLAKKLGDHTITYWCNKGMAKTFIKHLDKRISVRACISMEEVVGKALFHGKNRKWYEDAWDNLVQFTALKAYSAVKDLLSLIILHAHGGYYFDTTTRLPPGSDGKELSNKLTQTHDTPRVVGHPEEKPLTHSLGIQSGTAVVTGADGNRSYSDFTFQVRNIDVWAMYSPKEHPAMELAFMSYVSRCNRISIFPGGRPVGLTSEDGKKILKDKKLILGMSRRNDLIASLIIHSVYDGMLMECCTGNPKERADQLSRYCWPAEEAFAPDNFHLAALGLNKRHRGLWR